MKLMMTGRPNTLRTFCCLIALEAKVDSAMAASMVDVECRVMVLGVNITDPEMDLVVEVVEDGLVEAKRAARDRGEERILTEAVEESQEICVK